MTGRSGLNNSGEDSCKEVASEDSVVVLVLAAAPPSSVSKACSSVASMPSSRTSNVSSNCCGTLHELVLPKEYGKAPVSKKMNAQSVSSFLSGMNPMISSRNCTLQQSSVNCRDQCVHRESHCKIFRQVCMSFICMFVVLYYNSGWLSADTLQAVDLGLTLGQTDRSAAGHELRHKACRSVAG